LRFRCGFTDRERDPMRNWNRQMRAAETGIWVRRHDVSSNGCVPNDHLSAPQDLGFREQYLS
jgi:hypothetical protein